MRALAEIAREIDGQAWDRVLTSGSPAVGFVLETSEDPSVTHESYFEALRRYRGAR